ncbi:ABC transporter ATP-binding protein [Bacillus dakarensis]|uniref:ABC transporter ATP-binding protein n=1 Tax=Robertmurraya dakarensis TaxID=1926278 RepID=UPI0009810C81|nr:ABC transporter ATP-binding protein [Bacillus dakarensis]
MSYLNIHNLTVSYPFQRKKVLNGIDLQIDKGEKLLILGPSGGGKSTLALTLNGIIPKSIDANLSGTVTINGKQPLKMNFREASERVGILFQDPDTQFCMLTVEDEIVFGLENQCLTKEEIEKRLENSLELTGLTKWRMAQIKDLSGGMKQKLGLACLIAMDPEILILDEPTANLDPASTEEMFQLFTDISRQLNKTLIFIEHKLDDLLQHMNRTIVIGGDGTIMADGHPRDVFRHHYWEIKNQGIWIPQICKAAKTAEENGQVWSKFPLSIEEFKSEFISSPKVQRDQSQAIHALQGSGEQQMPLLQVENLSFSYNDHKVLNNVNFSILPGEFAALIGPNGAGKSTLSKLFLRFLKPESGRISFFNREIGDLKSRDLMQKVGYVFQNPEHQFICDTVEQELAYGFKILGWGEDKWKERLKELLHQFRLTDHRHHNPFSLSQGQKRRLSVATMLTNDQQLLILDEPTFGQDHINTKVMMELLKTLNQKGKTILMITHDMELVAEYANKVILLNEGSVAYEGDVTTLFKQKELLGASSMKVPISYTLNRLTREMEGVI